MNCDKKFSRNTHLKRHDQLMHENTLNILGFLFFGAATIQSFYCLLRDRRLIPQVLFVCTSGKHPRLTLMKVEIITGSSSN